MTTKRSAVHSSLPKLVTAQSAPAPAKSLQACPPFVSAKVGHITYSPKPKQLLDLRLPAVFCRCQNWLHHSQSQLQAATTGLPAFRPCQSRLHHSSSNSKQLLQACPAFVASKVCLHHRQSQILAVATSLPSFHHCQSWLYYNHS